MGCPAIRASESVLVAKCARHRSWFWRWFAILSVALAVTVLCVPASAAATYTYDAAGRLIKVDYGSAGSIVYTYDHAGNLTSRTVSAGSGTGGSCNVLIDPMTAFPSSAAGTGQISVTTGAGCTWTASSNQPWLTITSSVPGTGNGILNYAVTANTAASRVGTLTIGGSTVTVTQAGTNSGSAPIALAHAADGNNFKTEILLTNSGTSPASYSLRFDDSQGNVPSSGFTLTSGSLNGTIAPGQSATIQTSGAGPQTIGGWAELTLPPTIGGNVIYSQQTGLPSIQEGTANVASVSGTDFFVPFDNASGAITSMALTNPGGSIANVMVTLRYSNGTSETDTYPAISARNHGAFTFPAQFPNSANQAGVAEFVSSVPISVVTFQFNSTGAFTAFDAVPASTNMTSITRNLAHAADGNNFKTEVLLTNPTTTPAPYTLRFDDNQGNVPASGFQLELGSLTGTIPPGQSATIRTAGLGTQTFGGWAELTAPTAVGGSVIYSQNTGLPSIQEGTATILTPQSSDFFVPFDNTSGAVTSMALANSGASSATINVTLRYSDGTSETVSYPALASRNHAAFTLTSQFPNSANRTGVAEFVSTAPLSAVTFFFNSTGAFTAFGTVSR